MVRRPPSANPGLLSMVMESVTLRHVIAAWPNVESRVDGWRDDPVKIAAVYAEWSLLANVPSFVLERTARRAFANGMINDDGTVDPQVEIVIAAATTDKYPKALKEALERQRKDKAEKEKAEAAKAAQA